MSSYLELIDLYPDVLLDHNDKVEVNLNLIGVEEQPFTYDQSVELNMSDLAKILQGAYSIY